MQECCNPIRRIMAFVYDLLVNIAFWFVISLILVILNHGQALGNSYYPYYQILLFTPTFLFFTFFWSFYGQTIGMRAWHLKIVNAKGGNISFIAAIKRFLYGIFSIILLGLPIFFAFFDDKFCSLMESGSKTYIVKY